MYFHIEFLTKTVRFRLKKRGAVGIYRFMEFFVHSLFKKLGIVNFGGSKLLHSL